MLTTNKPKVKEEVNINNSDEMEEIKEEKNNKSNFNEK